MTTEPEVSSKIRAFSDEELCDTARAAIIRADARVSIVSTLESIHNIAEDFGGKSVLLELLIITIALERLRYETNMPSDIMDRVVSSAKTIAKEVYNAKASDT